jgi:hypothetical protein
MILVTRNSSEQRALAMAEKGLMSLRWNTQNFRIVVMMICYFRIDYDDMSR